MVTRKLSILEALRGKQIPKTKRRSFLEKMDTCVPWQEWIDHCCPAKEIIVNKVDTLASACLN